MSTFMLLTPAVTFTLNVGGVLSVESNKYSAILEPYASELSLGDNKVLADADFPIVLAKYPLLLATLCDAEYDSTVSSYTFDIKS